jgi:hypothetical protein
MTREPLLTEDEQRILEKLAEAWNLFLELPVLHQWDRQEFMHAIHSAQNIVQARPAMRDDRGEETCHS